MNDDQEYYVVTNIHKFSTVMRREALKVLYEEITDEEIDKYITVKQCSSILKKLSLKIDGKLYLDEDIYLNILKEISSQIHQSALSKLASEDIIECAWDDDSQQMVFWVKNNM